MENHSNCFNPLEILNFGENPKLFFARIIDE